MKRIRKKALEAKQRRRPNWITVIQYYGNICGVCGLPGANQVHEVIITRGDWPGHDDIITDVRNCLVVHEQCHRKAERDKIMAIRQLCKFHGIQHVESFVEEMASLGYRGDAMRKVRFACSDIWIKETK